MPIICPHVILDAFLHTLDVDNLSVCDRHNFSQRVPDCFGGAGKW